MTWRVPLFKVCTDEDDVEAVRKVIERGFGWAIGEEIPQFEDAVAKYIGVKYAVAVNSGTSALHVAMLAHHIGKGDEVIVPSFTFISTCNAPLFVGAIPVFADIEEKTYGLDPDDVERKITPKTKAIIAVHYAGMSCQIDSLRQIADKHGLILIEDAAEAFGASNKGRKVGSIGHSSIMSFCATKVITTGEGGMFLTNDRDAYEMAKLIRSHGRAETEGYFSSDQQMEYISLGYNFRMSSMTAALGLAQVEKVNEIIQKRNIAAMRMCQRLVVIGGIVMPRVMNNCSHVFQIYTVRVKNGLRDELKRHLASKGIISRIYFEPVHLSVFHRKRYGNISLPVTMKLSKEVLSLPLWPDMPFKDIDYVVDSIKEFMNANKK